MKNMIRNILEYTWLIVGASFIVTSWFGYEITSHDVLFVFITWAMWNEVKHELSVKEQI